MVLGTVDVRRAPLAAVASMVPDESPKFVMAEEGDDDGCGPGGGGGLLGDEPAFFGVGCGGLKEESIAAW